ncbi:chain length determinant protein [mine drainage metagenome]|uniref:Chain length determinant protein n=1 Tax=mine drainage metagenome TaxID=410659 RepID=A0A1J5T4D8_9ZZZZ
MDQASDEISLKDLIVQIKVWYHYLLSKWTILAVTGILGAAIGIAYAWVQKPIYTATVTYALDDEKTGGGMTGALGLASSLGFDLGGASAGGAFSAANLMELMHSKSLIEKTLLSTVMVAGKQVTLAEYYIEINDIRKAWANSPELAQLQFPVDANMEQFARTQDSVLSSIYANIDKNQLSITQKDKKVSIGTIEVKSINENFSKLFCEALVREVTDFYVDTRSRKARNNVNILQKQTDSVRAELNAAITGVAAANDNTFNVNPVQSIHKTPVAKRQVDVQANTAILTQLVANLEMAKVALLKETPLIQVIDKPILPLKKEKKSRLMGLIMGGFLGGFLMVLFLVFRRVWKRIMEEDEQGVGSH